MQFLWPTPKIAPKPIETDVADDWDESSLIHDLRTALIMAHQKISDLEKEMTSILDSHGVSMKIRALEKEIRSLKHSKMATINTTAAEMNRLRAIARSFYINSPLTYDDIYPTYLSSKLFTLPTFSMETTHSISKEKDEKIISLSITKTSQVSYVPRIPTPPPPDEPVPSSIGPPPGMEEETTRILTMKMTHIVTIERRMPSPSPTPLFVDFESPRSSAHSLSPRDNEIEILDPILARHLFGVGKKDGMMIISGFSRGEMKNELTKCSDNELSIMFPVVCGSLSLFPVGVEKLRDLLVGILKKRIASSLFLFEHFHFFLHAHVLNPDSIRLWDDHPLTELVRTHTDPTIVTNGSPSSNIPPTPAPSSIFEQMNRPTVRFTNDSDGSASPATDTSDIDDGYEPSVSMSETVDEYSVSNDFDIVSSSLEISRSLSLNTPKKKKKPKKIGSFWKRKKKNKESKTKSTPTTPSANNKHFPNIIQFEGDNPIEMFDLFLMKQNERPGFTVFLDEAKTKFYDPFRSNLRIHRVTVDRIFSSNAKPLLLECNCTDELDEKTNVLSRFIFKKGDDLRRDAAVLNMFRFMNFLWQKNGLTFGGTFPVAALTYGVIPISHEFGVIELIEDCKPLSEIINFVDEIRGDETKLCRLISSCAGSYIAAFVMGIRDRHHDNVLFRLDGMIFHIDFGYMLGQKVTGLDASKFAITADLYRVMAEEYESFIDICVEAWLILRRNAFELCEFAKVCFAFLGDKRIEDESNADSFRGTHGGLSVGKFIQESLRLDKSDEEAANYLRKKLSEAPKKWKTKMKNVLHAWNTSRK